MADDLAEKPIKKKRKIHNPLLDWLLYIALRGLVALLFLFSVERNLKTAAFLGRMLWKRYHRGRKRALDNLRTSKPAAALSSTS
jgi:lauroyl/myristoyl acyltransferase